MMYPVVVKEEAQQDILDAYIYYEDQQIDLGERFLKYVYETLNRVAENPQYYSFLEADIESTFRRIQVPHFPFIVIYEINEDSIVVYEVHNHHKKPRKKV